MKDLWRLTSRCSSSGHLFRLLVGFLEAGFRGALCHLSNCDPKFLDPIVGIIPGRTSQTLEIFLGSKKYSHRQYTTRKVPTPAIFEFSMEHCSVADSLTCVSGIARHRVLAPSIFDLNGADFL